MKIFENMKFLNCSQPRPINPVSWHCAKIKSRYPKVTKAATFTANFWFQWEKSPKESCPKSKKVVGRKGRPRANPEGYWSNFFLINP